MNPPTSGTMKAIHLAISILPKTTRSSSQRRCVMKFGSGATRSSSSPDLGLGLSQRMQTGA